MGPINDMENWLHIKDIYGQILEVGKENVIIKCLIDREKMIFREHKVLKQYLSDNIDVRYGSYVILQQRARKGKVVHMFENGIGIVPKEYFEKEEVSFMDNIFLGNKL